MPPAQATAPAARVTFGNSDTSARTTGATSTNHDTAMSPHESTLSCDTTMEDVTTKSPDSGNQPPAPPIPSSACRLTCQTNGSFDSARRQSTEMPLVSIADLAPGATPPPPTPPAVTNSAPDATPPPPTPPAKGKGKPKEPISLSKQSTNNKAESAAVAIKRIDSHVRAIAARVEETFDESQRQFAIVHDRLDSVIREGLLTQMNADAEDITTIQAQTEGACTDIAALRRDLTTLQDELRLAELATLREDINQLGSVCNSNANTIDNLCIEQSTTAQSTVASIASLEQAIRSLSLTSSGGIQPHSSTSTPVFAHSDVFVPAKKRSRVEGIEATTLTMGSERRNALATNITVSAGVAVNAMTMPSPIHSNHVANGPAPTFAPANAMTIPAPNHTNHIANNPAPTFAPPTLANSAEGPIPCAPDPKEQDTTSQTKLLLRWMTPPLRNVSINKIKARRLFPSSYVIVQFSTANEASTFVNAWSAAPPLGYETATATLEN
ncbi:hypothetical protein DXG03_005394 [Asterophora parasitica]|uniref:Uncharacterized protein n=1 Tax=Asterophora parasitica TaxID=117018 RepID=A0A9P7G216_9AGAR|nr:hypothetical protein DXG03_005394 [Asterophora parasitica]